MKLTFDEKLLLAGHMIGNMWDGGFLGPDMTDNEMEETHALLIKLGVIESNLSLFDLMGTDKSMAMLVGDAELENMEEENE